MSENRPGWQIPSRGYCHATGKPKKKYDSRADARRAARYTDPARRVRAFRCPDCGTFHVGHQGKRTRQEHRELHS